MSSNGVKGGVIEQIQDFFIHTTQKGVAETVSTLVAALKSHNLTVFSLIDHGKEAQKANMSLQEEQLIVFGDPKVGTFLMQENPLIGIELPLKILVFSQQKETHIAYPQVLLWKEKYGLSKNLPILEKMGKLYDQLVHLV